MISVSTTSHSCSTMLPLQQSSPHRYPLQEAFGRFQADDENRSEAMKFTFPGKRRSKRNVMKSQHEQLQEQEKRQEQQRQIELEEAKLYFQKGYDLCFTHHNATAALDELYTALNIYESWLGKYHEDTGKTYFWIGKCLLKLKDAETALVALSRSKRIFDRVLARADRYHTWVNNAIVATFRQINKSTAATTSTTAATSNASSTRQDSIEYRTNLEKSIAHEMSGDEYASRGNTERAISEYYDAIDCIPAVFEESFCHPDVADLCRKIDTIHRRRK